MRKVLALVVASFLTVGVITAEVNAGQKKICTCQCCQVRRAKQPSLFEKLWELEKKKNAWLLKTFLGR